MRWGPWIVIPLLGCAAAQKPETPIARLREAVISSSQAHDYVRQLSDRVGPRLSGSAGDAKAVAWAVAAMESIGLKNVKAEPVRVPRWVRGAEAAQIIAPASQPLSVAALGGSISTPEDGIEAEVVEVASFDDFAKLPDAAVRGRIAFFNAPMQRSPTGQGYGQTYRYRTESASIAARRGAVAVLVRSIATGPARLPHTGGMRYAADAKKIPAAALSVPDAELLHRTAGPIRVRLTLTCQTLPDAESANVVGEIVGREAPDEIVLLGAHLDSWDLGTGAQDDGAGVAIALETARQILVGKVIPRRTLRIALFANEENGLRGAEAYAEAHKGELGRHVAALEADAGDGKATGVTYLGGPSLRAALAPIAAELNGLGASGLEAADHFGVDLIPLRQAGVPMLHVRQDATLYFDWHHSADDTYDKIRPDHLAHAAAAYATVAFGVADSAASFGRVEPEPAKR